jgi:hypothetical protein
MSKKVSYSNTIGTKGSRSGAKNNSISTAADLAHAEKHANHDYTQEEVNKLSSDIDLSKRELNRLFECRDSKNFKEVDYLSLVEIVKDYYHIYFDKSLSDYNTRMELEGKKDKIIDDYYEYVSHHPTLQIACQGIIQLGNCILWATLSDNDRIRASYVYMELLKLTVKSLNRRPGCKYIFAGSAGHNNEASGHLHHYGIPILLDFGGGSGLMEIRVSKSAVFSREALKALQNDVRMASEVIIEREFDWTFKQKSEIKRKSLSKPAYIWLVNKLREKELETMSEEKANGSYEFDRMPKQVDFLLSSYSDFRYTLERDYQPIIVNEKSEDLDEGSETPKADTDYIRTLLSLLEVLFNLDNRKQSLEDEENRKKLLKAFWEMIDKDCTEIVCSVDLTKEMINEALLILEEERKPKKPSLAERISSAEKVRNSQIKDRNNPNKSVPKKWLEH